MIYTITLNPSIDHIVETKEIKQGQTNRADFEVFLPGGKGINVSLVLKNLGVDSTALGFVGGFTGDYIKSSLVKQKIKTDFVSLSEGITRINTKIKEHKSARLEFDVVKTETEINMPGPAISISEWELFLKKLECLKEQDVIVLSGSAPKQIPPKAYEKICEIVSQKEARLVVDTSGQALKDALNYRPFLIKPNKAELEELLQVTVSDRKSAIYYAMQLTKMGAENVIISLGEQGAVLAMKSGAYDEIEAFRGMLVNSVGAGDSLVAGFLAHLSQKEETDNVENELLRNAFRYGVCAASASAFSEGFATKSETEHFFEQCKLL